MNTFTFSPKWVSQYQICDSCPSALSLSLSPSFYLLCRVIECTFSNLLIWSFTSTVKGNLGSSNPLPCKALFQPSPSFLLDLHRKVNSDKQRPWRNTSLQWNARGSPFLSLHWCFHHHTFWWDKQWLPLIFQLSCLWRKLSEYRITTALWVKDSYRSQIQQIPVCRTLLLVAVPLYVVTEVPIQRGCTPFLSSLVHPKQELKYFSENCVKGYVRSLPL